MSGGALGKSVVLFVYEQLRAAAASHALDVRRAVADHLDPAV